MPGDWGKRLLVRKGNLGRCEQTIPRMLQLLGAGGLGALNFSPAAGGVSGASEARIPELAQLLEAAYRYDAGKPVAEEAMTLLFRAASSPGGARPKALIRDESGDHWLAKFPSARDEMDMIAIEAATLALAKAAGLAAPDAFVRNAGRRSVLFVKRFDVLPGGGRRHMISAQTLLAAEGYYVLGSADLFQAIRKVTSLPFEDLPVFLADGVQRRRRQHGRPSQEFYHSA